VGRKGLVVWQFFSKGFHFESFDWEVRIFQILVKLTPRRLTNIPLILLHVTSPEKEEVVLELQNNRRQPYFDYKFNALKRNTFLYG
jgi:hypothetical protein